MGQVGLCNNEIKSILTRCDHALIQQQRQGTCQLPRVDLSTPHKHVFRGPHSPGFNDCVSLGLKQLLTVFTQNSWTNQSHLLMNCKYQEIRKQVQLFNSTGSIKKRKLPASPLGTDSTINVLEGLVISALWRRYTMKPKPLKAHVPGCSV